MSRKIVIEDCTDCPYLKDNRTADVGLDYCSLIGRVFPTEYTREPNGIWWTMKEVIPIPDWCELEEHYVSRS